MKRPIKVVHGAVGGLLAGAVIATWFLIVDFLSGNPVMTPTILGSAVFGQPLAYPSLRLVALYSALHFAAFAALGAATASVMSLIRAEPRLLLGLVFGIGVLNAFHYSALLIGGITLTLISSYHVLVANFLGGMAFMVYLHRISRSELPLGIAALARYPLLSQGVSVGILGAVAVAAWFFLLDTLTGHPFQTPAALGSALLLGAQTTAEVRVNFAVVAAYTLCHLAAFAVAGVAFVWVAERMQSAPSRWLLVAMSFVLLEALFLGTVGAVGDWVLHAIGFWTVVIGNLIAVVVMGAAVWLTHPELRRRFLEEPLKTAL